MNGRQQQPWWERFHTPILLIVGLLGIFYETVAENFDRPYLLALFGGMVGLPFILHADRLLGRGSPPYPPQQNMLTGPPTGTPPPPPLPPPGAE